jgi:hypothetical protein
MYRHWHAGRSTVSWWGNHLCWNCRTCTPARHHCKTCIVVCDQRASVFVPDTVSIEDACTRPPTGLHAEAVVSHLGPRLLGLPYGLLHGLLHGLQRGYVQLCFSCSQQCRLIDKTVPVAAQNGK